MIRKLSPTLSAYMVLAVILVNILNTFELILQVNLEEVNCQFPENSSKRKVTFSVSSCVAFQVLSLQCFLDPQPNR